MYNVIDKNEKNKKIARFTEEEDAKIFVAAVQKVRDANYEIEESAPLGRPYKLTDEDKNEIKRRVEAGETRYAVAQAYHVTWNTINNIVNTYQTKPLAGKGFVRDPHAWEKFEEMLKNQRA